MPFGAIQALCLMNSSKGHMRKASVPRACQPATILFQLTVGAGAHVVGTSVVDTSLGHLRDTMQTCTCPFVVSLASQRTRECIVCIVAGLQRYHGGM